MIVNHDDAGAVVTSGVESNKSFNIKMGGKAFKMLSDTLYTNKPGSIVRELSCNAVDSHKAAGKTHVPFEIHLPTVYEPTFWVKDFGLGMSPEMIESTYTTYFESTKDGDNNSIGGMGLGGKTPFAYTKSFNITSVWNGVKYFYVAMLDENDVPSISKFGSENTTEQNGVTIEFNVESNDYYRFSNEVLNQLRFFAVKPIIRNVASPENFFSEITYNQDFGNLKIPENLNGTWIVQGGVGYPVDYSQFSDKVSDKTKLEFFNLYRSMVMFFDIGDIEVTISREGISYSKHTIDSIVKFVDEYAPKIFKNIKTKIEEMSTDWERLAFLNSDVTVRRFAKLAGLTFGVNGNIGDKKATIICDGNLNYSIELTKHWNNANTLKHEFQFSAYAPGKKNRTYFNGRELFIYPKNEMIIFVRDDAKCAIARIKQFIEDNPYKTVYVIEHPEGSNEISSTWVNNLQAIFGGCSMTMVSTLPEPPKSAAVRGGQVVVYENPHTKSKKFNYHSFSQWNRIYDEEEIESGYYLIYKTYPYIDADGKVLEIIERVVNAGLFDKPIYVIKNKKVALLKDNPNFQNAIEKAEEILNAKKQELMDSQIMVDRYNLATMLKNELNSLISKNSLLSPLMEASKQMEKKSLVSKISRSEKVASKYLSRIEKIFSAEKNKLMRELVREQPIAGKQRDGNNKIISSIFNDDKIEKYFKKYPMLEELQQHHYDGWMDSNAVKRQQKNMIDYIKLIDKLS